MGSLEDSSKKRAQKRNIKKSLLRALEIASLNGQAIQSRSTLTVLRTIDALSYDKSNKSAIARARRQMIASGLLRERDGILFITKKGRALLQSMEAAEALASSKERWDGRWRILIFDIPEERKVLRDKIRRTLQGIGFVRLQDSIWIYPYSCEDYAALLKAELKVGKELLYIIADEIEGVELIKQHFRLS